jgi:hypothetical protein
MKKEAPNISKGKVELLTKKKQTKLLNLVTLISLSITPFSNKIEWD